MVKLLLDSPGVQVDTRDADQVCVMSSAALILVVGNMLSQVVWMSELQQCTCSAH